MIILKRLLVMIAISSIFLLAMTARLETGTAAGTTAASITAGSITLEFDSSLHSRVSARFDGTVIPFGSMEASELLLLKGSELGDFSLRGQRLEEAQSTLGKAHHLVLTGVLGDIEKTVSVDQYVSFPDMLFLSVTYRNKGTTDVNVEGWVNARHQLKAKPNQSSPPFWSLQNGSYEKRPDWVVPLKAPFHQTNYLGMNATDYGGGTPFLDVWRPDAGLAIGHDELSPKLVSFPVNMTNNESATVEMQFKHAQTLHPGESLKTFIAAHRGDYFHTLREYRRVMVTRGVHFSSPPADGFEPIWCAWGFGRNFKPEQIVQALPEVKRLGFKWVTMDDGWQTLEGDWLPNPAKFPRGDADVRALVDTIHAEGFKAQLWWAPMAVSPKGQLYTEHRDWILLDPAGSPGKISWWNSFYLCPAHPPVVEFHRELALKAIKDWDFDGLKIDGQFLNAVSPCTNPAHHHHQPEDSVEAVPYFFKAISDSVRSIKPDALIELCPCGTAYSFYSMPYYNMSVASDPTSSFQVRTKGKTLKGLMGDELPYFGDHVELSDGGMDFASTIGVGGVIGTQFRWPPNDDKASPPSDAKPGKLRLTPAKEKIWADWVRIYRDKMLSKGTYLGDLYDIGFDKPETHVVQKQDAMFYAFYAPHWTGTVQLRGLAAGTYKIRDYVNNRDLGTVQGPTGMLNIVFDRSLLIEADLLSPR